MTGTWGYLANGQAVFIPERELTAGSPFFTYEPLRGSGHTLAVFDRHGTCVGWSAKSEEPSARVWE